MTEEKYWALQRNRNANGVFAKWLLAGVEHPGEIEAFFRGENPPFKTVFHGVAFDKIVNKCREDENLCALLPQSLRDGLQAAGCLS